MKKIIKRIVYKLFKRLKYYLDNVEMLELENSQIKFDNTDAWLIPQFFKINKVGICCRKPAYIWGVLKGAALAKVLGHKKISVIEFGVAGGGD